MKNKKNKDRLPKFDWEEHLDAISAFEEDGMEENYAPHNPWYKRGKRAKRLFKMLLAKLELELSKDDIDDLMDPDDVELNFGDATDDESLFEAVQEHLCMVLDEWNTIFTDRPTPTKEQRRAMADRVHEFNLIDRRIIPEEEYDAYMDELEGDN